MPEDGVDLQPQTKMLTQQEIVRLASMFVEAGVDKIRLTGGEVSLLLSPDSDDRATRLRIMLRHVSWEILLSAGVLAGGMPRNSSRPEPFSSICVVPHNVDYRPHSSTSSPRSSPVRVVATCAARSP